MVKFKRSVAKVYILFFYHSSSYPFLKPRKSNIQGFLDKTDNHWIDITNILKIAVNR